MIEIVDSVIEQSLGEDLLESWQTTEEGLKILRERPFESFVSYKTWAWLKAMDGNTKYWEEPINDFYK